MFELKPCPFCGGEAVMQSFSTQREKMPRYRVICDKCGIENGWEHFDPEEAAEAWNRRAGEKEVRDAVDEAIRVLNAINSSGSMVYGDYLELHNTICAICPICGEDMRKEEST